MVSLPAALLTRNCSFTRAQSQASASCDTVNFDDRSTSPSSIQSTDIEGWNAISQCAASSHRSTTSTRTSAIRFAPFNALSP